MVYPVCAGGIRGGAFALVARLCVPPPPPRGLGLGFFGPSVVLPWSKGVFDGLTFGAGALFSTSANFL